MDDWQITLGIIGLFVLIVGIYDIVSSSYLNKESQDG